MTDTKTEKCAAGCPMCPMAGSDEGLRAWQDAHAEAAEDDLRGGRLVGRAAVGFVLPIIGALIGVLSVGGGETQRFFGLITGTAIAMAVSVLIARRFRRVPAQAPCSEHAAPPPSAAVEESV